MAFLRRFTLRVVNPLTRRFAGRLPGFGLLTYTGRASGRIYHTPVNVFERGDDYLFALTYGSDVQWVKNVVAASGCEIRVRGRDVHLADPEVFVDPACTLMPTPVRQFLRLNRVSEFLRMRAVRSG
jgi:deazaflavin-dependent oxidoreductase (nitroreductase family)